MQFAGLVKQWNVLGCLGVLIAVVSPVYRLLPVGTAFFAKLLVGGFFLVKPEKFLANQSEMSGKSFCWLNMVIEDCISYSRDRDFPLFAALFQANFLTAG